MSAVVLYRDADTSDEEKEAIRKWMPATDSRMDINPDSLVIGRYSVLPYYGDLCRDLARSRSKLINGIAEHNYVADIGQWAKDLGKLTPKTWVQGTFDQLPEGRSFVLKGQTNSKKFLWNTHMFAKDKAEVRNVLSRLMDDTLISTQTIYAREYVKLRSFGEGLNGLPIANEFRFFVMYQEILCGGFYWASHIVDVFDGSPPPSAKFVPPAFMEKVIERIGNLIPFYVVDVAETENGEWLVTDVNDGQMSGLSCIEPDTLYRAIRKVLFNRDLL